MRLTSMNAPLKKGFAMLRNGFRLLLLLLFMLVTLAGPVYAIGPGGGPVGTPPSTGVGPGGGGVPTPQILPTEPGPGPGPDGGEDPIPEIDPGSALSALTLLCGGLLLLRDRVRRK